MSSCCWRVIPSSTPSWLSSTRPLTSGTKAEVTSVNTVAQLQQIIFVTQYPTIPNDITTAEDFCETFGRYFFLLYLLKKKKNENSTVLLLLYVQWDLFIKYALKKLKAVISFQSFLFFTQHVSYIENSVSKNLVILS